MDAHEALNGDLDNTCLFLYRDKFLYFHSVDGYICFEHKCKGELLTYICTVDEFNEYVKADKKLLKKRTEDKISCYVCNIGAYPMQQYCGNCGHELLSELIPPKPQPIFTKAMQEAEELPSVGMYCNSVIGVGNKKKVLIDFISEILVVVSEGNGAQYSLLIEEVAFEPIDTRTDKEKLFEQINDVPRIHIEDANKLVDDIIEGKVHGVKWVGK